MVKVLGTLTSAVLLFAGLVGLPSVATDLQAWPPILAGVSDTIGNVWAAIVSALTWDVVRLLVVVAGVALMLWLWRPDDWRERIRIRRGVKAPASRPEPPAPAAQAAVPPPPTTTRAPAAQPPSAAQIAAAINGFRERAENLRRDYNTCGIAESAVAFDTLVEEVDAYLRKRGLAKYVPRIEDALEIGFVPGSPYEWMHVGDGQVFAIDSPEGHRLRLERLRDALANILDDLPTPTYPVSMADEERRKAAVASVEHDLAERWEAEGGNPLSQPTVVQPGRQPTGRQSEERAESPVARLKRLRGKRASILEMLPMTVADTADEAALAAFEEYIKDCRDLIDDAFPRHLPDFEKAIVERRERTREVRHENIFDPTLVEVAEAPAFHPKRVVLDKLGGVLDNVLRGV